MQVQIQGTPRPAVGALASYDAQRHFCELRHSAEVSPHGRIIRERLDKFGLDELSHRARAAEAELYNQGITFTIYSDGDAIDRILPFDVIPRVITAEDWAVIESGVRQRVQALNLFLADVYGRQQVLKDGVIPADLVLGNANYRPEMQDLALPHGTYVHINGTDLVRGGDLDFDGATDLADWSLFVQAWTAGGMPAINLQAVVNPIDGDFDRNRACYDGFRGAFHDQQFVHAAIRQDGQAAALEIKGNFAEACPHPF